MFLKKIDLPYCLVVFFVVCPRLRALFWCSTAKGKRRQNSDFRSVRLSRRIIQLENYPRPQFLQNFKAEMLQFHVVHSLDSQFLPHIVYWRCFYLLLDRLPNFELLFQTAVQELRIAWMDMELQLLCFEILEELRPGVMFRRNYSPRATDTPEITVLPCLSLSSGTPK